MAPRLIVSETTESRLPPAPHAPLRSAAMADPALERPRVAVVCGGPAAEREVSLTSGRRVAVKPASQGSAVGVAFAESDDELGAALDAAFRFDPRVLVEEYVTGSEITVGILENPDAFAFPVIDIRTPGDSWYDFEHRYTVGLSEHVIPAPLPEDVYAAVQDLAVRAHVTLGCRDLSRVDFVVEPDGRAVLLEVNTLPGMTP